MKISYSCLIVVVVIGLGTVTAAPADVKAVAADAAKFTFMGHEYDTKLARLAREAAVDVRLAGVGANETAGRVEGNYLGSWGTICDDHWGMQDARVVCRQLNLGEPVAFTKKAHFGQGTGNVLLDNVVCTGDEENIAQCRHRGFNVSNCNHNEDAGVICSGPGETESNDDEEENYDDEEGNYDYNYDYDEGGQMQSDCNPTFCKDCSDCAEYCPLVSRDSESYCERQCGLRFCACKDDC